MSRTAATLFGRLLARTPRPATTRLRSRRRAARATVLAFSVAVALIHLAVVLAMEASPRLRDPEYGRRAVQLRARVAEHPNRPLVLVFGSSRTAMGVRPAAWEDARPGTPRDPLLFNLGAVGGGPVIHLLMADRIYADGMRPDVVLLEFWPLLLRQDAEYADLLRRDPKRLLWRDRPVIRAYAADPEVAEYWMRTSRVNVVGNNATNLMAQIDSLWLPKPWQHDGTFAALDGWGWLPGMDPHPDDAAARRRLTDNQHRQFAAQLRGAAVHPDSERALRDAVALARAHGARVGLLVLPESREFQDRYPPGLERDAAALLARLSGELAVPVIDARDWMDERLMADGLHLSRAGAVPFTVRLAATVAATFPPAGGAP